MDSSVSPSHGEQEMSIWNGHYACARYHPLFVLNQFADLERCALRPGNVHSANGWDGVFKPVVSGRTRPLQCPRSASSWKPSGSIMRIRLPANKILLHRIGYLLERPVGRPSNEVRREAGPSRAG
jgi:DDE family transposase